MRHLDEEVMTLGYNIENKPRKFADGYISGTIEHVTLDEDSEETGKQLDAVDSLRKYVQENHDDDTIELICRWLESDEAKSVKHCNDLHQSLFGQTGSVFAKEIRYRFLGIEKNETSKK